MNSKGNPIMEENAPKAGTSDCRPYRVQRKRTKGWRKPPNTLCVTRPGRWGNEFAPRTPQGGIDYALATEQFRARFQDDAEYRDMVVRELRGKNLACYCPPGTPCHAEVLLAWANEA